MILKNTTKHPDHMLRRMVSWCCKELRLPGRKVGHVQFGCRQQGWRGRAWPGRILVRIGTITYPTQSSYANRRDSVQFELLDEIEVLIFLTAHELGHVAYWAKAKGCGDEASIDARGYHVLKVFRERRDELLRAWAVEPKQREVKSASRGEKNEQKARDGGDK